MVEVDDDELEQLEVLLAIIVELNDEIDVYHV